VEFSARYENNWVHFDRTDTELTGGWVNGARTNLRRRMSENVSVGGEYGVRFADLNEGTHQVTFQEAGGTIDAKVGPRTTVTGAGGLAHLTDRTFNDSRQGLYVRAEVTHATEHATVGTAFERNFVPSFGFGGSTQSEQLRAYVRMPLDRNRAYVQSSVAWRRSDPLVEADLPLDALWVRGTVGYALSRWLRAESTYAYTHQNSQVPGGKVSRNRIGAQLVISQPMRIQ
jgi:hypothetical protein